MNNTIRSQPVRSYTRTLMRPYEYIKTHDELERELSEYVRVNRLLRVMDRELRDLVGREAR